MSGSVECVWTVGEVWICYARDVVKVGIDCNRYVLEVFATCGLFRC